MKPLQIASFGYQTPPGYQPIKNINSAYVVSGADLGSVLNCTSGTFNVTLPAAGQMGAGWECQIWNTSATSTDAITISPNAAETIDGRATLILQRGEGMQVVCDGTNWQTGYKKTMRLYAENMNPASARPTASGDFSVAIGNGATASGATAHVLGVTSTASAQDSYAIGRNCTASAQNSFALGQNSGGLGSRAVTNNAAMALGGSYASGTDSFAAAVANNTSSYGATGTNSISIGYQAKATSNRSVAVGWSATSSAGGAIAISGSYAGTGASVTGSGGIAIGDYATVSASYAVAIGAVNFVYGPTAAAVGSTAIGSGARTAVIGKYAYSGGDLFDGTAFVQGIQYGVLNLGCLTSTATPRVLQSDGINATTPTTNNQIILPNNSAFTFSILVVARQKASDGTASAAWNIEGLIRRENTAASTTLVTSTVTAISNVPGWTIAVSADTTNGGLALTATGAAATNIRWFATAQTVELIFA